MGGDSLMSVRCKYGIARTELSSLLPLINTMQNKSIENQNYELFIEAIQDVKFSRIGISNCSIKDVVMDANLYLTDDERVRFYKMCRLDYETLLDTLNQINENVVAIPTEELRKLRQIYFENEFIGHYRMPTYDMNNEEQNIQQEIIKGIYLIYADFEKEIERMDIPTKHKIKIEEFSSKVIVSSPLQEIINQQIKKPVLSGEFAQQIREIYNIGELEEQHREMLLAKMCKCIKDTDEYFERIRCNHDLTDTQLHALFELLQQNDYISKKTNIDICVWLFGKGCDPMTICEEYYNQHKDNLVVGCGVYQEELIEFAKSYIAFKPIVWTKSNSRTNFTQLNKKALFELLKLLGVDFEDYTKPKYLTKFFQTKNAKFT